MTPVEIAVTAAVFLTFIMLVFVFMFFTTTTLGKRHEREFLFPVHQDLFRLYRPREMEFPFAIPIPGVNSLQEQVRQAISDGRLIRARQLSDLVGELKQEPDYCPRELREVLLPGLHQLKRPVSCELIHDYVAHPAMLGPLTPVMATLADLLLNTRCAPPGAFDLQGEHRAANRRQLEPVLGMLFPLSRLLLNFEPELFYLDEEMDLVHASTLRMGAWVPSLVVGRQFMQRPREQQLVLLARKLILFRPEFRMLVANPSEEKFMEILSILSDIQEGRSIGIPGWNLIHPEAQSACREHLKVLDLTEDALLEWRKGAVLSCHRLTLLLGGQWFPVREVLAEESDPGVRVDLISFFAKEQFGTALAQLQETLDPG